MTGIPVLSVHGWVTNKKEIMTKLFEHFITSEYSQSNSFKGGIASLKYIIAISSGELELKNAIVSALTTLYSAYFKLVTINVIVDNNLDSNIINYTVDISCTDDDNVVYILSKIISEQGGALLNINETIANLREMRE
jgi:hypothetical protein